MFLRGLACQRQSAATRTTYMATSYGIYFVQMTVTYQVGGGGHLDIDFWVCIANVESVRILCANVYDSSWQTQKTMLYIKRSKSLPEQPQ